MPSACYPGWKSETPYWTNALQALHSTSMRRETALALLARRVGISRVIKIAFATCRLKIGFATKHAFNVQPRQPQVTRRYCPYVAV